MYSFIRNHSFRNLAQFKRYFKNLVLKDLNIFAVFYIALYWITDDNTSCTQNKLCDILYLFVHILD